jgi:hypothetical protein
LLSVVFAGFFCVKSGTFSCNFSDLTEIFVTIELTIPSTKVGRAGRGCEAGMIFLENLAYPDVPHPGFAVGVLTTGMNLGFEKDAGSIGFYCCFSSEILSRSSEKELEPPGQKGARLARVLPLRSLRSEDFGGSR